MAYADGIRSSNYTREELATLIDQVIITSDSTENTSLRSTSSTTPVALSNTTVTVTPTTDSIVLVSACMKLSHSVDGDTAFVSMRRNSTTTLHAEEVAMGAGISGTAGNNSGLAIHFLDSGQSGSTTYDLLWEDGSNSGTVYTSYTYITAVVFRTS